MHKHPPIALRRDCQGLPRCPSLLASKPLDQGRHGRHFCGPQMVGRGLDRLILCDGVPLVLIPPGC
eukprot:721433-Amphidinium_carterae.1